MKKILIFGNLLCFFSLALAHGGGQDSQGGHFDTSVDVLPELKHWDSKTLLLQQGLWDQQQLLAFPKVGKSYATSAIGGRPHL